MTEIPLGYRTTPTQKSLRLELRNVSTYVDLWNECGFKKYSLDVVQLLYSIKRKCEQRYILKITQNIKFFQKISFRQFFLSVATILKITKIQKH